MLQNSLKNVSAPSTKRSLTHLQSYVSLPKRFYQLQRLHIYEEGGRNSNSGVSATIFGASSALGVVTASSLTRIGSQVVLPYRKQSGTWDNRYKEIKTTADLGYKNYLKMQDMTNEKELEFSLKSSNVAISCVGSHVFYKKEKDFEEANIRVPMAIAKAVKNSPQIKRFVYVSAAGADPNSQSKRLRTKWIGEQEVKAICPDATIIRPTYMVQGINPNVTIAAKWGMHMKMFNRMLWQIEGMEGQC